jgi:hypothetical protein
MKTVAALGLAGLLVTITSVASADDSKLGGAGESCERRSDCQAAFACIQKTCVGQTASARVVVSDASLSAGFAPAREQPHTRMKSPGQVVGGIVLTVLGLGVVGGSVGMIGWWASNKADSVVDSRSSSSFYSGVGTLIGLGVIGTVGGIVLISQGARRVELQPGLGSLSLSGTF